MDPHATSHNPDYPGHHGHDSNSSTTLQPRAPRLVFWETTEACNLACLHCRRLADSVRAAPDQLTTAQAIDMIDQLAQAGCQILVFSGGEPLMRPDIYGLLEHASSRGLMAAVASNGTLITDEVAARLVTCGVRRVSISLDGPDAPTHDSFRRIDGSFDAALAGIAHLRQAGIGIQINTTVAAHNHLRLQDMYDLAGQIGADALHFFMLVPVGCGVQLAESMTLNPQRYEEILNWIYDKDADGATLRVKATCAPHYMRIWLQRRKAAGLPLTRGHGMYQMSRGCLAGTEIVFVSHRGQVFPCGYLPVPVGDLRTQSFGDIWQGSPALKAFREPVRLNGKCGACEYMHVCLGCRARAYALSGDILAEEPCCLHQPAARESRS